MLFYYKTIPGKDLGVFGVPYSFTSYARPLDLRPDEPQVLQWETASWFNGLSHHWGNHFLLVTNISHFTKYLQGLYFTITDKSFLGGFLGPSKILGR